MIDRAVARRYAEAFVNRLEDVHRLESGLEELKAVAKTYADSMDLRRFLGSPEIGQEDKERLLRRLWEEDSEPEIIALWSLLLRWDRVDHLPQIAEEAVWVAEGRQGILRGKVTTARPISLAETQLLADAVGGRIGKKVVLERAVDQKILGGVRVSVGTTLLDTSVQSLLEEVGRQLKAVKVNS